MFAYIPARINSKRIPKKNIKFIGGKPVIIHVINELNKIKNLKGIAVSTNSSEIIDIVKSEDRVVILERREDYLCNDDATIHDLIMNDMPRFEKHFQNHDILFTFATSALVKKKYYDKAIELYKLNKNSLIMSVVEFTHSPFLSCVFRDSNLVPLFPECYAKNTNDLEKCYIDSGSFYLFNSKQYHGKSKLIDFKYVKPVFLPNNIGIDIDYPEDWKNLERNFMKNKY